MIGSVVKVERSAHRDLFEGFTLPNPEFSPVPIWWWGGDRVELPRLCWQLDQLADQGIFNVIPVNLAPVGPHCGALADDPPLFSDEWWRLWFGLAEHARERGVRLWFYDQIGFSGANLQGRLVAADPSLAGADLDRLVVDTDEPCELRCPPVGTPVSACALPLDTTGAVCGAPVEVPVVDGTATWRPPDPPPDEVTVHRVSLIYSVRRGFDYTSARACGLLLRSVHGEFERRLGRYLGNVIAGSFEDELPSIPTWSPSFADEFAKRIGYRLEPVAAALWDDWGVGSSRVRFDYQQVRAALAEDAFFKPLFAWHEKHGMTVGVDQQSPARSGEPVACTQQYADYMRTHRWYSAPGSDHWGDAKIHSSLAHHYGRRRTWIESFHSSGWGGTLEETFDWLMPWLLAGATLYNPHAVYYTTKGGWWEWAAPSTCWRQPYWRHYRGFADTVSRLCWLLSQGEHVCDVGVLFPSATIQAATLTSGPLPDAVSAHDCYLSVVGRMAWFYTTPGELTRAGHDFDVLDDDSVAGATVVDSALHIGKESYRAVVVPSCRFLETATAAQLVTLCERGGLVIFIGELPEHATDENGDEVVQRLRDMVAMGKAHHLDGPGEIADALSSVQRAVRTDGRSLLRRCDDLNVLLVPAAPSGSATGQPMLPWIGELPSLGGGILERYSELRDRGYDFDPLRYRHTAQVRIDVDAADVEQWDPLTGTVTKPGCRSVDGGIEVTVDFATTPAAVLVWRSVIPDGGASDRHADGESVEQDFGQWAEHELDGAWTSTVVPTMDNRFGDFALPATRTGIPVQQWRLGHRLEPVGASWSRNGTLPDADDDSWADVLVGQGTWAWRLGPISNHDIPAPLVANSWPDHGDAAWTPVRYSLSRGIDKDPLHSKSLGPKGRVPEEFWHVDEVQAGQVVVFRTALPVAQASTSTLAVAANGTKEIWWNGRRLVGEPGGDLRLDPVDVEAGRNLLEIRVTAERDGPLRGYWTLTREPAAFARPSWLGPADGSVARTTVTVQRSFVLDGRPRAATLQLGTQCRARLLVNGREVAIQGGFDPYGDQLRVLPHDVREFIVEGENLVEVRLGDAGEQVAVLVDALIETTNGEVTWVSDRSWTMSRDGTPVTTTRGSSHPFDPRWAMLRARAHPLPQTSWLHATGDSDTGVIDVVPDAFPVGKLRPAEWFSCVVPPGAVSVVLPVAASAVSVWLDGLPVDLNGSRVQLPAHSRECRTLLVRMQPEDGRTEGALWNGPLVFELVEGRISPGEWQEVGLGSFSGGVSYRRTVILDDVPVRAVLDLGAVRGTAEVAVNGTVVGARVWSPYRFEITPVVREGDNDILVTVFNTLAPYMEDVSPTTMVFAGQRTSGLFGPVSLFTASENQTPGAVPV